MKKIIGIIGCGNMGSAIAENLKKDFPIFCFDKDNGKTANSAGVKIAANIEELIKGSDVVILAIKPQDFGALLEEVKKFESLDKLFISIAAGVTIGYIEQKLGIARVVRVMPNMPAKIGAGVSCISGGKFASEEDLDFADEIFDYLGEVIIIKEGLMNAATAISGSGPAYVCDYIDTERIDINNISEDAKKVFIDELEKAAKGIGFDSETAGVLVKNTFSGTVEFLKKAGISAQELKKQVTSKGGTTEAALAARSRGGSWEEAIKAALKRAEEISRSLSS